MKIKLVLTVFIFKKLVNNLNSFIFKFFLSYFSEVTQFGL